MPSFPPVLFHGTKYADYIAGDNFVMKVSGPGEAIRFTSHPSNIIEYKFPVWFEISTARLNPTYWLHGADGYEYEDEYTFTEGRFDLKPHLKRIWIKPATYKTMVDMAPRLLNWARKNSVEVVVKDQRDIPRASSRRRRQSNGRYDDGVDELAEKRLKMGGIIEGDRKYQTKTPLYFTWGNVLKDNTIPRAVRKGGVWAFVHLEECIDDVVERHPDATHYCIWVTNHSPTRGKRMGDRNGHLGPLLRYFGKPVPFALLAVLNPKSTEFRMFDFSKPGDRLSMSQKVMLKMGGFMEKLSWVVKRNVQVSWKDFPSFEKNPWIDGQMAEKPGGAFGLDYVTVYDERGRYVGGEHRGPFSAELYLYHATNLKALKGIIKEGLVPGKTSLWQESAGFSYFSESQSSAIGWLLHAHLYEQDYDRIPFVLLRTPGLNLASPYRWNYDDVGSRQGLIPGTDWMTNDIIPPGDLEVYTNKGWLPLPKVGLR